MFCMIAQSIIHSALGEEDAHPAWDLFIENDWVNEPLEYYAACMADDFDIMPCLIRNIMEVGYRSIYHIVATSHARLPIDTHMSGNSCLLSLGTDAIKISDMRPGQTILMATPNNGIVPGMIQSIEYAGNMLTYGMEIDEPNHFPIVDGFVTPPSVAM